MSETCRQFAGVIDVIEAATDESVVDSRPFCRSRGHRQLCQRADQGMDAEFGRWAAAGGARCVVLHDGKGKYFGVSPCATWADVGAQLPMYDASASVVSRMRNHARRNVTLPRGSKTR